MAASVTATAGCYRTAAGSSQRVALKPSDQFGFEPVVSRSADAPFRAGRPQGAGSDPVPVEDRQLPGARRFAIASNDTSHAVLIANDAQGRVVGDGSAKLRDN